MLGAFESIIDFFLIVGLAGLLLEASSAVGAKFSLDFFNAEANLFGAYIFLNVLESLSEFCDTDSLDFFNSLESVVHRFEPLLSRKEGAGFSETLTFTAASP